MGIPKPNTQFLIAWAHHVFFLWWVQDIPVKRLGEELLTVLSDSNS